MFISFFADLLILAALIFLAVKLVKFLRTKNKSVAEIFFLFGCFFAFLVFVFGMMRHGAEYKNAIDPVDNCYTPFGEKHFYSLLFYFILYHFSLVFVWIKGRKLPPLFLVLCLIFLMMGIVLNIFILIQTGSHGMEAFELYKSNDGTGYFYPFVLMSLVAGILMVLKVINSEKQTAETRSFRNPFLNRCNEFLKKKYSAGTWAILFFLPVILLCALVLILFGQDYDSLSKVFTETATWTFSQKMHPPPLDHRGHYLCTVSACGSPKIVKPIRIGKRHGRPLIVNRQLQIANAFEELVADFSPKLHRFIRKNYDRYGYNLSRKINTKTASNLTYILMKPLEWLFLIFLYLFCEKPERKIARQYL